jgi:flagellar hook-associated protein 2
MRSEKARAYRYFGQEVMGVTISGTFSGLNVSSIISTLIAADSVPITNLQNTDTSLESQSTKLGALSSSLGQVSLALQTLGAADLFQSQVATSSNPSVGNATVSTGATAGTTNLNITQLATTSVLRGGNAGGSFSDTKLSAPPAASASIDSVLDESSVAGQTFSINGTQITLSDSDTLQNVLDQINGSSAGVTASYDASTGKITLASTASPATPIVLGSGSDTSDFLQQAELFNNGAGAVTSSVGLGRIDGDTDLASAGLRTAPTAGTFSVNGVAINYTAGETLNDVISSINSSSAGVSASYDSYEDQLVLSATSRGPQSITVADGSSNLATALRLTTADSSTQVGQPTLFTVNGSPTVRQSDSNILTASQMGLTGVNFTATATGATEITVAPDVTTIASAINSFVSAYNSAQSLIATDMYVDPNDPTQDGPLASDTNLTFLASQLRSVADGSTSATATIRMLSDLGVDSNATDNTLTDVDTTKLQDALTNNLGNVESLFNDPTTGLTNTIQTTLDAYDDPLNGVIVNEQNSLTSEVSYNTQQISTMQEQLQAQQTALENEFALLDEAEANAQSLSGVINSSGSGSSSSGALSSLGSVGSTSTSGTSSSSGTTSSSS